MRLTRIAVDRWQLTLVLFGLMSLMGLNAFRTIPRAVDPHYPVPTVVVAALQPGAEAIDMEQTVARPIEDVLQGLDDVREIRSRNTDGASFITIDFNFGTDAEDRYDDVVREVTALRPQLPASLQELEVRRVRLTEAVMMQLALVSADASTRRLEKYAEDLRDRLNVVAGVRQTRIYGLPKPELQVRLDTARLAALQLSPLEVVDALRAAGADLAAGPVHAGMRRYNVETGGAFRSIAEVADVAIRGAGGRVLRVDDVAQVGWGTPEQQHITRLNGMRAIFVTVRQKDGADVLSVRHDVREALSRFRARLPSDMRLEVPYDQSRDVDARLGRLGEDFAIALVLVLLTLLPLGLRAALVVAISIPLSLAIGLVALAGLGFSLNQLSIAGFILALGLLVDDSIVVTENIARHLRLGASRREAALTGTQEIALPVLGCTGVLLFAFLPLCFLPDVAGSFTRPLPAAVMLAVAASLLVSLTLVPFLASWLLPPRADPHGNWLLKGVNSAIERAYAPLLRQALDRPWVTMAIAGLLCLGALALLPGLGFRLFPIADAPMFLVEVKTAEGTSVPGTDAVVRHVSRELGKEEKIRWRLENAGSGNPQVFYNVREEVARPNVGAVLAVLDAWDMHEGPRLLARLRKRFDTYPDARIVVRAFENGVPVEAPVVVRVSGPDLPQLKRHAGEVERLLRATSGVRDIDNPLAVDRTDIALGLDEGKAAALGVPPGAPRRMLRLTLAGEPVSRFRDQEGDSYPVVVRLPIIEHHSVEALGQVYVPSSTGASVPLDQIATPRFDRTLPEIGRYRLQRTASVTAQIADGYLASDVNARIAEKLGSASFGARYAATLAGEVEARARSTGGLGRIALLALFGILGVLVWEFGRFREVFAVAGVIPLGLVGGIVALKLVGEPLSYLAIIGFIAMIGIEIKNSILLIDFTTRLRDAGLPLRKAVEMAGEIRFLPVLLTSVTAVCGLLPLAYSGLALYTPLAWVIIGGLVSSTLLSRLVVPALYLLMARRDAHPVGRSSTADLFPVT